MAACDERLFIFFQVITVRLVLVALTNWLPRHDIESPKVFIQMVNGLEKKPSFV